MREVQRAVQAWEERIEAEAPALASVGFGRPHERALIDLVADLIANGDGRTAITFALEALVSLGDELEILGGAIFGRYDEISHEAVDRAVQRLALRARAAAEIGDRYARAERKAGAR